MQQACFLHSSNGPAFAELQFEPGANNWGFCVFCGYPIHGLNGFSIHNQIGIDQGLHMMESRGIHFLCVLKHR